MKKIKIFIFSVICLFSYCIVFASNEVVIKSITPVYDEESSIIVSNENNNYNVTFNEKDQNIKYKIIIENTTENELKVSNIDLTEPSASYLTYEIENISKDDILKSKEIKEIVISLTTTEKDKDASDFEQELLSTISFEKNVENPYTSSKELILVLIITTLIVLIGMVLLCKNNKISHYMAIFIICFSIIPIIKADSIIELQIKINVKYETPKIIEVLSGDGTKTGDEIRIGKEHFYVISNDGTNATLLAKYNLEVGHDCIYNSQYVCTPIENASGIQNSKARGLVPSEDFTEVISNYGSVTFNNGKIYVDNYKTYIEKLGIVINSARLIEYEELVALGCSASNRTCTTSDHEWLYTTTYWTSSILGGGYIYIVTCNGGIDSNSESNDVVAGVRPVIVIPSSSI